ncbi:TolC family protein [Dyadobacter psychrophilus]|uniref:Outer membrane protein TolC n=1 Tax=Dyadobacter psychrophilus TaxID=651661 RepID=A0A1T5E0S6_9BACT|nr:TolC family protein [Dyadobacter psychrophilus]SKB77474.1 Outer membrane protein TolC [Dyadobacter psychrophilus]
MSIRPTRSIFLLVNLLFISLGLNAQVLTLNNAVETALTNYASIKAKNNYLNASKATVQQSKKEYLPNFNLSAQQDYGTVNGQNGPLYGLGLSVASSGLPLPKQNWNAAFGALYLTNVNWDFFAFGRARERINVSQSIVTRDESDLAQEQFQHSIRVAAAYLNLLAAQRLTQSWQNNLERANGLKNVVVTRAKNGLIPGVDSSLANAEVSNAKISITQARDFEQEQANTLARLMGVTDQQFVLDTMFITKMPRSLSDSVYKTESHPLLQYYANRIAVSNQQAKYFQTLGMPTFTAFGVFQGRGAGFSSSYATDQHAYTQNYFEGIKPVRANYLIGIGATWNMTGILRTRQQVLAQNFISNALKEEYNLADQQIKNQLLLSENKIRNATLNFQEAPVQVKSASDAYLQKSVLYKNGLSNIVDVTQSLYILTRAETNRDIALSNLWQALLLKAAAAGDFNIFMNQ